MIDTWAKLDFEIWFFLRFVKDKMASLGPIDFQVGLSLNINVNDGKTNLKSISQKLWSISAQRIGYDATFAPILNGRNSAMFHTILKSGTTKIISSSRRIE